MRELVIRMIYCEMLGHCVDFGYINAIKLISATEITQKRVGYMATWLSIPSTHELVYLIVANMQKDLKSPNLLEVCASLNSINKLIGPELIPCLLQDVQALLKHAQAPVRKKAILAIQSFYKKSESSIGPNRQYRIALCDKDPQVMNGALMLIHDLAAVNPAEQRDLVPSLVSILKQITEHRLTRDYDYHRVPAPWIQIRVMKILALLGAGDREASSKMYDVLAEVLKRSDTGLTIGNALLYEMIRTVTTIMPHPELLDASADYISKFLTSTSANLKYIGITALSRMVLIDPKHAVPHQHIVIDCLEDHDATIRRKTLNLLYAMTSPRNVEVIVNRLIRYLEATHDASLRADLVKNLCEIIDKYASSNLWYVDSMVRVLELGAADFSRDTLQTIIKLVAEGGGEDDDEDHELRVHCVEKFYAILGSQQQQSDLMYVLGGWIIGEYGYLSDKTSSQMMVDRICDILERPHLEDETRGWLITACMKLISQQRRIPDNIEDVVNTLKGSVSISLSQRCFEFLVLFDHLETLAQILPLDGCCEDIQVDRDLRFLDGYVSEALQTNGGHRYDRERVYGKKEKKADNHLKIDAYEMTQTRKVDADLTLDRLQKAAPEKLQVSDSHKRWGRANLEVTAPASEASSSTVPQQAHTDIGAWNGTVLKSGAGMDSTKTGTTEPAQMVPKTRRTQKEKFASDLFGALTEDGMSVKPRTKNRTAKKVETVTSSSTGASTGNHHCSPSAPVATEPKKAMIPAPGLDDLFSGIPPISAPIGVPAHLTNNTHDGVQDQSKATSPFSIVAYRQFEYGGPLQISSSTVYCDEDVLRVQIFFTLPPRPENPYEMSLNLNPRMKWQRLQCNVPGSSILVEHITIPSDSITNVVIQLEAKMDDLPWTGTKGPSAITVAQLVYENKVTAIQCSPIDLLRPLSISLEEFGSHWPQTLGESAVPSSPVKPITWSKGVADYLLQQAHINVVSVIDQELVAACRLITTERITVMVHVRWNGHAADFTVRSLNKALSESVVKSIAALFR